MTRKTTKLILENLVQKTEEKYTPDKRVEVFSIKVEESSKGIELKGETTNKFAYKAIITHLNKYYQHVAVNIRLIPDEVIGEKNWGVVYNSVASLHSEPSHKSEIVSQVLLGMPIKILDNSNNWFLIQAPEGYIGWISSSIKQLKNNELKDYLAKPKIVVTSQYAKSYSQTNVQSQSVSDIVIGNILNFEGEENNFYKASYPDGRIAFIEKQNAKEVINWLSEIEFTGESIANRAKQLMGTPYVWGGTSSKGLDCSGFAKIIYWLHGVIIPRDASQQALCGVEVDSKGNFDNVQKGDLVFFGTKKTDQSPKEKVVHVGIYIGNKQFIHADDYIHISSFNPNDKLFDKFNTDRYLRTMRYIGAKGTTGITPILAHPFYNMR